jgi:hypothetical protein
LIDPRRGPSPRGLLSPPDKLVLAAFAPIIALRSSSQQRPGFLGSVIDFDLKHRIGGLQLSTRCFGSVDVVKFRLEMTIDDRHEPLGWRPVGS